ncbi:MAG TPA: DegT/DnrJ/EryC1/StrS family aminotransferase [Acidobacteriaceae bacterium]|nr:DegT/DnrJ/EryC1/StrS family aminotransferase [Acidobacteriaceae bacterium]
MAQSIVPFLDLSREYRALGPRLLAALDGVLSQQRFILGDEVAALEREVAARCGVSHAVGCASGTDALWLALAAAGIGPGAAVLTTPFSFFATVSAILRAGAVPVLADIEPESFNLSPQAARICVEGQKTIRAILPVHLFGQAVLWDDFLSLQREFRESRGGLWLIEDAAQALGARWGDAAVGSLGDAAAFSFYPTKNLAAAGDAGMVATADDGIAERIRLLRQHGMRHRYHHEVVGWNSRLDTLQAALLLVKLPLLDDWNARRRALAAHYAALLEKAGLAEPGPYPRQGVVLPRTHPKATHVFHQYVIRVPRRDELKAFLDARGIGSEIYYPVPLHLQPAFAALGYGPGDFPEAERAAREVLALPIYPQLEMEEQECVVAAIADFLS